MIDRAPVRETRPLIGAAIAARTRSPMPGVFLAVLVVAIAGTVAWYATRGPATSAPATIAPPPPPTATSATIKFVTEPVDAAVDVLGTGRHDGTPWAVTLAPGPHQIEIRRAGFKAYLTTLDVAAGEGQTLRIVLEPVAPSAPAH